MLKDIQNHINRLIALYESERQAKDALVLELRQKNAEIDTYRKQITDLERQVDNLMLTGAFTSSTGSNSDAKQKIDRLISEIDKCLVLLEK